jgi:hypothetical protein
MLTGKIVLEKSYRTQDHTASADALSFDLAGPRSLTSAAVYNSGQPTDLMDTE